jgi:hypothetical protein
VLASRDYGFSIPKIPGLRKWSGFAIPILDSFNVFLPGLASLVLLHLGLYLIIMYLISQSLCKGWCNQFSVFSISCSIRCLYLRCLCRVPNFLFFLLLLKFFISLLVVISMLRTFNLSFIFLLSFDANIHYLDTTVSKVSFWIPSQSFFTYSFKLWISSHLLP